MRRLSFLLVVFCSVSQDQESPDNAWGGWWPKAQWNRNSPSPGRERVATAPREWTHIHFTSIDTPWGQASVMAGPSGANRLRFDLLLSATAEELDKGNVREPKEGELEVALVRGADVFAKPVRAPALLAWAGGSLGSTGDIFAEFDRLSVDLEDTWVRYRLKDRTAWFLLPYGIGGDPTQPLKEMTAAGESPKHPPGAGEKDAIVVVSRTWTNCGAMRCYGATTSSDFGGTVATTVLGAFFA